MRLCVIHNMDVKMKRIFSGKSTTMIVAVAGTRGWQVGCVWWWCLHSRGTLAGGRTSAALSHTQPTLACCWLGGAACRTTTPCSSLLSAVSPVLGIGFVYWKLLNRIFLIFCERIRGGGDTSNFVVLLFHRNPSHGLGNYLVYRSIKYSDLLDQVRVFLRQTTG